MNRIVGRHRSTTTGAVQHLPRRERGTVQHHGIYQRIRPAARQPEGRRTAGLQRRLQPPRITRLDPALDVTGWVDAQLDAVPRRDQPGGV